MEMDHDVRTHAAVLVNFHESCTFFFRFCGAAKSGDNSVDECDPFHVQVVI